MALWAKKNQKILEERLQIKLQQVNRNLPSSLDSYLEFLKKKYAYKTAPDNSFENLRKVGSYPYLSSHATNAFLRKTSFFNRLPHLEDVSKLSRLFFRK
jgi:hypothetical protein